MKKFRSRLRKYLPIIIIALLMPSLTKADPAVAPIKEENGTQVYVVQMADAEYRIPVGYFRYVHTKPNEHDSSVLIDAALPDMHVIVAGSPESPEVSKHSWGPIVHILLYDAKSTTSFEFRFAETKEYYGPIQPLGEQFGLQKFVTSKGSFGASIRPDSPVYSDKTVVEKPTPEQKTGLLAEFYTDVDTGNPSVYITCDGVAAAPSPSCSEIFTDRGLLYQVDYGKSNLKDWAEIKEAAIKLMQGFVHAN